MTKEEGSLPIGLTLSLASVNYILSIIGKQPMEEVEGLVQKIRGQAQPQIDKANVAPAPVVEPASGEESAGS